MGIELSSATGLGQLQMPRTTHTWVVVNLLPCKLARERILANYVGFLNRLRSSAL